MIIKSFEFIYIFNPYFKSIGGGKSVQDDFVNTIKLASPNSKIIHIGKISFFQLFFFLIKSNLNSRNDLFILQGVFNLKYILFDLILKKNQFFLIIPRGDYIPSGNENWPLPNIFIKKLFWKIFIKQRLSTSKGIIFTSNAEMLRYLEMGVKTTDLYVIPDAYNLNDRFDDNTFETNYVSKDFNRKYILYVGRFSPEKNIEFLIDLISQITKETIPNVNLQNLVLVLVSPISKYDYYKTIMKKIAFLQLENKILIDQKATKQDIVNYYINSELVLLPSHIESFGLTVLESIYFNKNVIVSTNTPWDEFKNPLVTILPLNTNLWKSTIYNLLNTNSKNIDNSEFLSQFHPNIISNKWSSILKKINNEIKN
jgi:glycosyltransferase involved in cell wall biosynthesis